MRNLQRTFTRTLAVTVLLIMGLVLAGCGGVAAGKMDADLSIDKNLRISGTYKVVVDVVHLEHEKSIFTAVFSESELEQRADEMINDFRSVAPEGMTVEKIRTSSEVGIHFSFDKVSTDELDIDGVAGPDIVLEKVDGGIEMQMANPLSADALSNIGIPADPSKTFVEAQMTLAFPGDIIKADGGQVDGNTVTYDLRTYSHNTIAVTADASNFPWALVIIIGVSILLVTGAAAVIFIIVKKRKARSTMPSLPSAYGQNFHPGPPPTYSEHTPNTGQMPYGHQGQTPPQSYSGYQGQTSQWQGTVPPQPPQG